MSPPHDATAKLDENRVYPYHQAAITLIYREVLACAQPPYSWLDLACGRGQMLAQIEDNVDAQLRQKVSYIGYDINADYLKSVQQLGESLGFFDLATQTGELKDFEKLIPAEPRFHFISFTNTVHEIEPSRIGAVIVDCLLRLHDDGSLYVYDVESLPDGELELGAVPWTADEMKEVLELILAKVGSTVALPPQRWRHPKCKGWSILLPRKLIKLTNQQIAEKKAAAVESASTKIAELIVRKLEQSAKLLESLTRFGGKNPGENVDKVKALYDFWALSRVRKK